MRALPQKRQVDAPQQQKSRTVGQCLHHFRVAKEGRAERHRHADGIEARPILPSLGLGGSHKEDLVLPGSLSRDASIGRLERRQDPTHNIEGNGKSAEERGDLNRRGFSWIQGRRRRHSLHQIRIGDGNVFGRVPSLHHNDDRTLVKRRFPALHSQANRAV